MSSGGRRARAGRPDHLRVGWALDLPHSGAALAFAGRGLDEDRGRIAKAAPPWWRSGRLDCHLCGSRIQLGAIANPGGNVSLIVENGGGGALARADWPRSPWNDAP